MNITEQNRQVLLKRTLSCLTSTDRPHESETYFAWKDTEIRQEFACIELHHTPDALNLCVHNFLLVDVQLGLCDLVCCMNNCHSF